MHRLLQQAVELIEQFNNGKVYHVLEVYDKEMEKDLEKTECMLKADNGSCDIDTIRAAYDALSDMCEDYHAANQDLNKRLAEFNAEVDGVYLHNKDLATRNSELDVENAELKKSLTKLMKQLDELRFNLSSNKDSYMLLQHQLEDSNRDVKLLLKFNEEYKATIYKLEEALRECRITGDDEQNWKELKYHSARLITEYQYSTMGTSPFLAHLLLGRHFIAAYIALAETLEAQGCKFGFDD